MPDQVLGIDDRWQEILFYKCCYQYAALRSAVKGDKGTKGQRKDWR
jgi:hypothetical protein